MVNLGGATAADVRALIAHAQRLVHERFGQSLEPEIGFIGEFAPASTQGTASS
jgi:UDP-N-acetylmuramate dehydrogenase